MATIDALGQHIEACSTCQDILETLDGLEDSVVANIKGQAGPLPPDPQLQEQIREAEQISRVAWGEPQADASEESLPVRVGQYQVLGRIGRGGMGTVCRARHPHLKRDVAIKVLPKSRLHDPEAIVRFQREMEAVGRLDHPNLVRAHDAGEVEGQHFLVMEYLDGTNLRKLVREHGPLPVADACAVIRQAALGLQYAHEHGLIHRDIKPSNLMLISDGTVKVLDLGLARFADEATPAGDATSTGQVVGTGDFISPEQGQDTRNADARSDIYSLGCTLYYLLAGKAPFSDARHNTFVQKVMAHAQEPIPPIQTVRNDVPDSLAMILEQMLAKDPAKRVQTAGAVAAAMDGLSRGTDSRSSLVRQAGILGIAHPAIAVQRSRSSGWPLMVLLTIVLAVAIGAWYVGTLLHAPPQRMENQLAGENLLTEQTAVLGKAVPAQITQPHPKTNATDIEHRAASQLLTAAIQEAQSLSEANAKVRAYSDIAEAEALVANGPGARQCMVEAETTAKQMSGMDRANAFGRIAGAWAKCGDLTAAKKAAEETLYEHNLTGFADEGAWIEKSEKVFAYVLIAEAQVEARDISGARHTLGLAKTLAAGVKESQRANDYCLIAVALAKAEDVAGGKTIVEQTTDESQKAFAYRDIAAEQARAGDVDGARATAGQIANESQRMCAYQHIAEAQARAGDFGGANRTTEQIDDESDKRLAYREIAASLARAGNWTEAKAIVAKISGNEYVEADAYLEIAVAQAEAQDFTGAETTADRIGRYDKRAVCYARIAAAQGVAGNLAGMRISLEKAKTTAQRGGRDYGDADVYAEIAAVEAQAGNVATAIEMIAEATTGADERVECFVRAARRLSSPHPGSEATGTRVPQSRKMS